MLASVFGLSNLFARALGGIASDLAAKRWGMRGRLWTLWIVQSLGGACSIGMSYLSDSLGLTMIIIVAWSIFVPMACGASYGVAPFITRRGLGAATGFIGAGGESSGRAAGGASCCLLSVFSRRLLCSLRCCWGRRTALPPIVAVPVPDPRPA